jgi:hypothetical protein
MKLNEKSRWSILALPLVLAAACDTPPEADLGSDLANAVDREIIGEPTPDQRSRVERASKEQAIAAAASNPSGEWYVITHTTDLRNAGSDATVMITVDGVPGFAAVNLDNTTNNFERGQRDVFPPNFAPTSFRFGTPQHVPTGITLHVSKGDCWHPSTIEIARKVPGTLRSVDVWACFVNQGLCGGDVAFSCEAESTRRTAP